MAPARIWLLSLLAFLTRSTTAFLARPSITRDIVNHEDHPATSHVACVGSPQLRPTHMAQSSEDASSKDQLEIVLFGVGDLRTDDHVGLSKALGNGGGSPRKVLPLLILDDVSLSNIPGVVSHTIDTAKVVVAAVEDLQQSLQKLDLNLAVISSSRATLEESLLQAIEQHASSNTETRVHVHDLGDADNEMGYGPYAQLKDSNELPSNVEVAPWTCNLRATPWRDIGALPERYPDFVNKFTSSEAPQKPISLKADATKGVEKIEPTKDATTIPTVDGLVDLIQERLGLDPEIVKAEVNTGILQSHWGGLDANTVGESKVLRNLNTFTNDCQEEDMLWVQHPDYVAKACISNERSLEHATFNWMLRGSSGEPETNNLLAGETMTRYLSAPLLLGTVSARRLWHMSTRPRSFFVSPLKTLAEGREWHKLLAAKNIRTKPEYESSEKEAPKDGRTRYGYWRWHGFLCRYAQTPLATPAGASPGSSKDGVLLFHGFGASASQWNQAMEELSSVVSPDDGSLEGLAPDLIGFGESEKPPISYSIYVWDSQCSDFVKEIAVSRQGWDGYIVGGNSIGGFSAASTAANECAQVEGNSVCSSGAPGTAKCQGVVLMNPAGPIQSREDVQKVESEVGGDRSKLQTVAQLTATGALPPCKPPPRPVARSFGNGLLSYLRPRIQSICVNLYPTNPSAVNDKLCDTIERDSVDPGGIAVMISGTKLPPPRSMNEMLQADYGGASKDSAVPEVSFGGPVLVATGVLDPLNDAKGRSLGLAALRDGVEFDPIQAGHCPHDELPKDVAVSIAKWMTSTVKPMKTVGKSNSVSSVPL